MMDQAQPMSQGADAFANFDEGNDDFMVGNSTGMDTPGVGVGVS